MERVAVIGAGPAGLAAAWELSAAGHAVDVYDRNERPGGLLRTELLDGAHVDVAVQLVASAHTSLFDLLGQAGLESLLQRSPGRDALWRRGRAHAITYGSVSSMISSGALPTTLKLKLGAKYLPYLTGSVRGLDASDLAESGGERFDDESIATWGRRELGDDFVELLAYPLLAAYYGALPEETGAGVYHALAKVGMDVRVFGASGGFGALAAELWRVLESRGCTFHGAHRVAAVGAAGEGVEVDGAAYAAAVIAVPATQAAAMLADYPAAVQWLQRVRERSTFTVAYRLDRRFPADYFGLSFPRSTGHGAQVAAVCIQGNKLPGLVDTGDALLLMPTPAAAHALWSRTDDEVSGSLLQELAAAVPGIARHVTASWVFRFEDAYTVFEPGHVRRQQRFPVEGLPPTLALAGDYRTAPSVEGAVRSGRRAAQSLSRGRW